MDNGRDLKYDFIKGILIFCITWGHVITAFKCGESFEHFSHIFVRVFDLPLFAYITGKFLRTSSERHSLLCNCLNKIGHLLFPALLWELIFGFVVRDVAAWVLGGSMWFLASTFICTLILLIIDKIASHVTKSKHVIVMVLLAICFCALHTIIVDNRWHISFLLFPSAVGFYSPELEGWFSNKCSTIQRRLLFFIYTLFIVSLCFWKTDYNIWNSESNLMTSSNPIRTLLIVLFRSVIGIVGCWTVKRIVFYVYDEISRKSIWNKVRLWIEMIGKTSMEEYILQCFFVSTAGATVLFKIKELLGINIFTYNINFMCIVIAPITTVFALWVQFIFQKWIKKIPVFGKFIFGFSLGSILFEKKHQSTIKTHKGDGDR